MKCTTYLAGILLFLSSLFFTNCTAERDFVSTPGEVITQGSWGVKSLQAGSGQTAQYATYTFAFGAGGTVTVNTNGETVQGAWRWVRNVEDEVLHLQLPDHSALPQLNAQWTLQQWGLHNLTLKKGNDVLVLEQLSVR